VQRPVTDYASLSFPGASEVLAGAVDLMHRIRTEFKYDPKATVISTPLTEVFEKRHGVCQDFAHVMIAGLRGLGLPAAYVSGYLRTIPPPGQPRRSGGIFPTSLRSTASSSDRASRSSAWRWTCCWWNNLRSATRVYRRLTTSAGGIFNQRVTIPPLGIARKAAFNRAAPGSVFAQQPRGRHPSCRA
jgi:hypothetical protein